MKGPLEGLTISLCGTFNQIHAALAVDIDNLGGKYSSIIDFSVTHLVATEKIYRSNGAKIKQAKAFQDIKIVAPGWLLDSIENKTVPNDDDHIYDASTDNSKDTKSQKRARSPSPPGDEIANSTEEKEKPQAKKLKGEQPTNSKPLHVPVDEECPLAGTHTVFIDEDGTIFDASLNQTVSGENKNKFYRVQILESANKRGYRTWTRWGRVGERGQNATLGQGSLVEAKKHFDKKFKDKSGYSWDDRFSAPKRGKYTFIERNYEEDSDGENDDTPRASNGSAAKDSLAKTKEEEVQKAIESKLHQRVQVLMELIFNQTLFDASMLEMEYDANKLPLGKLSKRTLMAGYERLKEIAELMADSSLASSKYGCSILNARSQLSDAFYTVIPHNFGRNRPPVISSEVQLKKEIALLESLSDMEIASAIMKEAMNKEGDSANLIHLLDRQYAGLGLREMTPLEKRSNEYKLLEEYLIKSSGATHSQAFKLEDIFRIERQGENDRFLESRYGKLEGGDRRLLWHGSRTTNFGGILSQGLRIAPPEAPVNGYMFGKGVYLADTSSKSALYCSAHSSGNTGLLLLCEAELGKPMQELIEASSAAASTAQQKGMFSTWGQGRTGPKAWKDASCVHQTLKGVTMPDSSICPGDTNVSGAYLQYNEYIAYDVAQIRLRYLLRVRMR